MNIIYTVLGKLLRFALGGVCIFLVLPTLFITELMWPIRIGVIRYQRIGHLAGNCDIFLRSLQLSGNPRKLNYILVAYDPANQQLLEMWKRLNFPRVSIIESKILLRIYFAWSPILKKTRFWDNQQVKATEFHIMAQTKPLISFTPEEEDKGQRKLQEMGIGKDDWFICFHARDGAYYRKWRPQFEAHWKYTDFRNVDINLYFDAAKLVANHGGFALRYGAIVEKPLPNFGIEKIIDYSTHFRSDFMDIYLAAKCRFFLGSASGPDAVPSVFNTRVVSAAHFPYNLAHFHRNDMMVPRLLLDPKNNKIVPFYEAQENGYYVGWTIAAADHSTMGMYQMQTPDPADIAAASADMLDQEAGKIVDADLSAIREYYAARYLSHSVGWEDGSRISPSFAKRYKHLIVPPDWDGSIPQSII